MLRLGKYIVDEMGGVFCVVEHYGHGRSDGAQGRVDDFSRLVRH